MQYSAPKLLLTKQDGGFGVIMTEIDKLGKLLSVTKSAGIKEGIDNLIKYAGFLKENRKGVIKITEEVHAQVWRKNLRSEKINIQYLRKPHSNSLRIDPDPMLVGYARDTPKASRAAIAGATGNEKETVKR